VYHDERSDMDEKNEEQRAAERYAAGILAEYGTPSTYAEAQTLLAIAYLEGSKAGIEWTRNTVIGR
jgi:hypothetical protein